MTTAAFSALASAAQAPQAVGMRVSDTGRVSVDPVALANSPEFLAQVAAVKRLREAQAAPAATNDCARSHPHEAMSAECQVRAVIAEMRSKEARGAEATEHELGEMADRLTQALEAHTTQAALQPAAQQGAALDAERTRHSTKGSRLVRALLNESPGSLNNTDLADWIQYAQQLLTARATAAPAAQGDALDSDRLNWLEARGMVNIERVQYMRSGKTFYEITFLGEGEYEAPTLRGAIDAARAAQEGAKHG